VPNQRLQAPAAYLKQVRSDLARESVTARNLFGPETQLT